MAAEPAGRLAEIVSSVAGRRGLRVEQRGDGVLVLRSGDLPLYIEVRESSRGVLVRLGHESLRDYVREVLDSEENPREVIEEAVDEMSMVAFEVAEALRKAGLKVELDTRSAAMDVLDELEEAEEE